MKGIPNILFITSDQQNPNFLGIFDDRLKTPNLDRLAKEGITFTRSYVSCPLCTPARATWITGQYPFTHGAWSVGTNLDKSCLSLPKILSKNGYRTAIIGKSHLEACGQEENIEGYVKNKSTDYFRKWAGPWYGFDYAQINTGHVDENHSASMHYRAWLEDNEVDISKYFRPVKGKFTIGPCEWSLPEEYHPCKWAADKTIEYIENHTKNHPLQPFYLNLNFPEPHRPFKVPQPWYDMFKNMKMKKPKRRWEEWKDKTTIYKAFIENKINELKWHDEIAMASMAGAGRFVSPELAEKYSDEETGRIQVYSAMIALVDHHFGRVWDTLNKLDLTDNTFVFFTSDHGDYLGEHFIWSKGAAHYDGCLRVPTIARWQGKVQPAQQTDALFSNVDIAPTFLDVAGLNIHPEMQGISQLEAMSCSGKKLRKGVLVDHRAEKGLYVNTWVTDRYRLSIHNTGYGINEFELYDLVNDKNEFVNLAAKGDNWKLISELAAEMIAERSKVARVWQRRPCFS